MMITDFILIISWLSLIISSWILIVTGDLCGIFTLAWSILMVIFYVGSIKVH